MLLPGVLKCWKAWQAGAHDAGERAYSDFLPNALFAMQSLEHLTCYGKRAFDQRYCVAIHDGAPALRPTHFGSALAMRWAQGN